MDDLVAFVEARLADDEQAATQCVERDWQFSGSNCHVLAERSANGSFRTIAWCANGYDDDLSNSIHIAVHDPARVLREVEAKRQILRYVRGELADDETDQSAQWLLQMLAAPFADHPDFLASWLIEEPADG
jgi:HPt (histidine-containing phosphotransfer) domain-containing protein